jgi:hypothetical protein
MTPFEETSYPKHTLKSLNKEDTFKETSYAGNQLKRLITQDTN